MNMVGKERKGEVAFAAVIIFAKNIREIAYGCEALNKTTHVRLPSWNGQERRFIYSTLFSLNSLGFERVI